MSDAYDATSFELDYCQADVSKITAAIKNKASLLAIGMPGCGKSRLIGFLFNRPDVLEKYGLPDNLKAIKVDGDIVAVEPHAMYTELLRVLEADVDAFDQGNLHMLKDRLSTEVKKLEANVNLVVIFDNFNRQMQRALGQEFFNFMFALRNARPKLNVSYIFMTNLKIDFTGFYKVDRLFDQGPDRSVCWLSLLNRQEAFFSIDRQLGKAGASPDALSQDDKQRIFELGGGHALLNRYLSHLMLSGEVSVKTEPHRVLEYGGVRTACEAIWNDLEQSHKNLLIDLANGFSVTNHNKLIKRLKNYGVLTNQTCFFSPLFENFVKEQEKVGEVIRVGCDENQTKIVIKTVDSETPFLLERPSPKKEGLVSPKRRSLLCYLLANQGEICAKDQLIQIGWPLDKEGGVSDQALSRQIEEMRNWLRDHPQLSKYIEIETCRGVGYKLIIKG